MATSGLTSQACLVVDSALTIETTSCLSAVEAKSHGQFLHLFLERPSGDRELTPICLIATLPAWPVVDEAACFDRQS